MSAEPTTDHRPPALPGATAGDLLDLICSGGASTRGELGRTPACRVLR